MKPLIVGNGKWPAVVRRQSEEVFMRMCERENLEVEPEDRREQKRMSLTLRVILELNTCSSNF